MSPCGPFEAGSHTTIAFTFTVGDGGLKEGGRIRIATPNQGWEQPVVLTPNPIEETIRGRARTHNPWKPINTTFAVHTCGDAWVRLWVEERMVSPVPGGPGWEWARNATVWRWWIVADVEIGDFAPGDRIVITYGDADAQPGGIRVQPFPHERDRPFLCAVDATGTGELREASGSPVFPRVFGGPPERTVAVAPSIAAQGQELVLRASVLDRNLTPPDSGYEGSISFAPLGEALTLPRHSPVRVGGAWELPGASACVQGVGRVRVRTEVDETETNPTLVLPENVGGLYWGDIHAQCIYHQWRASEGRGDSTLAPAELFQYAREGSLLDFVANSNGGCPGPSNPGWEETQQAVVDAYEPGRFASLKSWECGMGQQGDRCLIYREADVEPNFRVPRASERDPTKAHALLRFCRENPRRILTAPHHLMKYMDWSVLDPEIDRLLEIYSCWGSYESRGDNPLNDKRRPLNQSAMYALGLGYTLGIVAAGDSHVGYPGRSLMQADPYMCQNWKAGLAAVYAPELTREAIWDALHDRHCYGTTGARIVLCFHLNGNAMGSELEYHPRDDALCERRIDVTVCGTDLIRRVDIVKNNGLLQRYVPEADATDIGFVDQLDAPPQTRDWYYVRVFQADGNAAWSSPIWIGPQGVAAPSPALAE